MYSEIWGILSCHWLNWCVASENTRKTIMTVLKNAGHSSIKPHYDYISPTFIIRISSCIRPLEPVKASFSQYKKGNFFSCPPTPKHRSIAALQRTCVWATKCASELPNVLFELSSFSFQTRPPKQISLVFFSFSLPPPLLPFAFCLPMSNNRWHISFGILFNNTQTNQLEPFHTVLIMKFMSKQGCKPVQFLLQT